MLESKERCWERLESVVKWSNLSINHFAHHIGLRNGENLYQIKRCKHGISRKLAETIVEYYPQINVVWLLWGKGEMFTAEANKGMQVNYFDVDVEANISAVESLEPRSTLMLPMGVDVDFAMQYRGDAMGSAIPTNSVVMVKRVTLEQLIPGNEYIIQMAHFSLLRVVRGVDGDSDKVRLVAHNSEKYDDMILPKSDVVALYRVVAKLIINN